MNEQETVEEASKRIYSYVNDDIRYLFIHGAKWQDERYKVLLDEYDKYTSECIEIELKRPLSFKKWIEHYKKKL
jgi:hypothetical protein